MPTVSIGHVDIKKSNNDSIYLPVQTALVDSPSGVSDAKIVRCKEDLNIFFPDILNRQSYLDILDAGDLLLLKRISNSLDKFNKANVSIGCIDQAAVAYRNTSIDLYNPGDLPIPGSPTFSSIPTFSDVVNLERSSITLSLVLELSSPMVNGDYVAISTKSGNAILFYVGSVSFQKYGWQETYEVTGNTVKEQLSFIKSKIDGDCYNSSIKGNTLQVTYSDFVKSYKCFSLSGGSLDVNSEYNTARLLKTHYSNDSDPTYSGVCYIESKYSGPEYCNILVDFSFPSNDIVQIKFTLGQYSESYTGTVSSNPSQDYSLSGIQSLRYIEDIINENSKIVTLDWGFLGEVFDEETMTELSSHTYHLYNAHKIEYTFDDVRTSLNRLYSSSISSYLIFDTRPNVIGFNEAQYQNLLIEKARKFNCALCINYKGFSNLDSDYSNRVAYISGDVRSVWDLSVQVLPVTPFCRLSAFNEFLGIVPYNVFSEHDTLPVNVNSYTVGKPNRLDHMVSANGRYSNFVVEVAMLKVTKTITNYLRTLVPNVNRKAVNNLINTISNRFSYVDHATIDSYQQSMNSVIVGINITSTELNVRNRKLNIEIEL